MCFLLPSSPSLDGASVIPCEFGSAVSDAFWFPDLSFHQGDHLVLWELYVDCTLDPPHPGPFYQFPFKPECCSHSHWAQELQVLTFTFFQIAERTQFLCVMEGDAKDARDIKPSFKIFLNPRLCQTQCGRGSSMISPSVPMTGPQ